nr:GMC family oxidoreductase N-terminal domain-containing protein [Gordonia amicalis]
MRTRPADSADYVVVGAGSAGSIVASRLAASCASVVVLEAGGTDRRPDVAMAIGRASIYRQANWLYPCTPDSSKNDSPTLSSRDASPPLSGRRGLNRWTDRGVLVRGSWQVRRSYFAPGRSAHQPFSYVPASAPVGQSQTYRPSGRTSKITSSPSTPGDPRCRRQAPSDRASCVSWAPRV